MRIRSVAVSCVLLAGMVWGQSLPTEGLPPWLHISGEFRTRTEGRTAFGFNEGNDDAYTLIRTRVNVDITPAKWLQFSFQGQDARAPGLDPGRPRGIYQNPADIRQAYVRIGSGTVKLTAGRQLLNYGAQRLIGPLDWTNTSRNWDAAKLELGTVDAKVDLFASSVVQAEPGHRVDRHVAGANLHGIYGSFKKWVPASTIEPYMLWRTGGRSVWTSGFRMASTRSLHGFDYQLELVRQWGKVGNLDHSAYAGYGIGGYTLAAVPKKPHLSAEYSYASGDRNPTDSRHTTFDHLFGTNHLFYGIADNVGWQNIHNLRVGGDVKPNARVQVNVDYHWFWLDSAGDALYGVAGTPVATPKSGNRETYVGSEIDVQATWTVSRAWKAGGGVGHMFAGAFLKQNSPGSSQTFPYLFALYSF